MASFAVKVPSQERLIPWVTGVLVILLAYVLAQGTWRLIPDPVLPETPVMRGGASAETSSIQLGLEEVADLHLFGERTRQHQPAVAAPIDAPETRLNLVLRGLFAADRPDQGAAIIADSRGNEKFYLNGDHLPGGAQLKEVHVDRVILARGGRFETLKLPKASRTGISLDDESETGGAAASGVRQLPELRNYREKIRANPTSAFDLVRMRPVSENGRLKGYRVSPGKDRELFRKAGLRSGDVVTGINGMGLDDPARTQEVFKQLTSASQLELVVERGGRQQQIVLSVD
ncbi:type II secretion system protein GspC [Thiohalomonas denitrificans]|uniref:type II secretion system protein GspC n=1 Tax=Thiohalomonas denitrificans TaxID=415747 RepID=UPI0026ED2A46|nr:type II secretion system protein GspC [Thiohalomonas denitrificans]